MPRCGFCHEESDEPCLPETFTTNLEILGKFHGLAGEKKLQAVRTEIKDVKNAVAEADRIHQEAIEYAAGRLLAVEQALDELDAENEIPPWIDT